MPYRLLIELAALELLLRLPPAQRRRFVVHLHRLQDYPTASSDYRDKDAHDRQVHVSIFDGYAVYYWLDEADRQVKVLEIIAADRHGLG